MRVANPFSNPKITVRRCGAVSAAMVLSLTLAATAGCGRRGQQQAGPTAAATGWPGNPPPVLPSPLATLGEFPKVVAVAPVAEDVLAVRVHTGFVTEHGQAPYVAEPGDEIVDDGKAVRRNGRLVGVLVGPERKTLFRYETTTRADFDPMTWQAPGNLALVSADDAAYSSPRLPAVVHRKTRPIAVARTGPWEFEAPLEHTFYVKLPQALTPGRGYKLLVRGDDQSTSRVPLFLHDPARQLSDAVHVSQIGFRPDDPAKIAFVSTWMGSGGPLAYGERRFSVLAEPGGEALLTGALALTVPPDKLEDKRRNHTGTPVYAADLSELGRPGTYRVCVENIGCSPSFEIADDVWRRAFAVSAKGFYNQRRSIEIGPPYTAFQRPRNLDPAIGKPIYQSRASLMDTKNGLFFGAKDNFGELVAGKTEERCEKECWGGLMDAGDWDSRIQHLVVTTHLLELAELSPKFFGEINLNIPESGNDLPDVVDEALFNLDHYRRMQLPNGGIRGGVESAEHPIHGEASWQESLDVFVYAPDLWSSYLYAVAAAHASEVLSKLGKPELADEYAVSAKRAMRYAEGEWKGKKDWRPEVRDARNYAAAALFRLTSDKQHHKLFLDTTVFGDEKKDIREWQKHDQSEACWVYLQTKGKVDDGIQKNCRAAYLRHADYMLSRTAETAFGWASNPWAPIMYGGLSAPQAREMVRAYRLTGDEKYLRGSILSAQFGAGANPLNMTFTTGVGLRFPERVLHVDSEVTGQKVPIGITVCGPVDLSHESEAHWQKPVDPFIYPAVSAWPTVESFWNTRWFAPMTEYTVQHPMAENALVWGYLAVRKKK